MRSFGVAVPKEAAERVRGSLLAKGLLQRGAAIAREGHTIFIPVTERIAIGYPVSERDFPESFRPIRSYKEVADVPTNLRPLLPTSFDVIGDIAILRVPDELTNYAGEIANAILRAHTNVRVVAADAGVKGALRIRDLRILAGPPRTETVHKEFRLAYHVDVAKAYFSPRLASERLRVAEQVQPGEVVVDLFAGVGPYAILIAKRRQPRAVYAFDANPSAIRYLEENVRVNRAAHVEPRSGDALELLKEVEPADRIIVDYPQNPDPAYRAALPRVLAHGVIHWYGILEAVEREDRERELLATAKAADRTAEVVAWREVHGWSPTRKLYSFDMKIV